MKYTNTMIELGAITVGENPRIPNRMLLDSLKDSIRGIGLTDPIMVWEAEKGKGVVQVIRGHRRLASIHEILAEDSVRFNELFPKGIPVVKVSDISADEALRLKLDHSDQLGLSDPHELQRSANMLFAAGKVEADVAMQLSGLIDKISPMNDKARVKLAALKAGLAKAESDNNPAAIELAKRDIRDHIFTYRRGFVQNLHNIYRCPDVVMASLYKKACGESPKEYADVYLPPVTTSEAVKLYQLHAKDCETLENGVPKFNKTVTGPEFNKKWAELCAKHQEADGKVKETRAKAMSSKDMEEERKGYKSALAVLLTRRHCGEAVSADIAGLDEEAYRAGLVKKYNPEAWLKVVALAMEIESKLAAESVAATAKA